MAQKFCSKDPKRANSYMLYDYFYSEPIESYIKTSIDVIVLSNIESDIIRPSSGDLVKRHIESTVRRFEDRPLMEFAKSFRCKTFGVPNYYRFLLPMNELNLLIEESAKKQRFQLNN
jgi:hypothetical protein